MDKFFKNLILEGTKRYYIEDLTCKDFSLEHTAPYKISVLGTTIEKHAWGDLNCEVVKLLINTYPKQLDELLSFRCSWTKTQMFTTTHKSNHKLIQEGLFLNCNHTALHSCWLLQELLDFFGVNKAETVFLIHRAPSAEPREIREYYEKTFKLKFKEYLCVKCGKTEEEFDSILSKIENLNRVLEKDSKSYNNLFLFDEYWYAYNYAKKVQEKLKKNFENRAIKSHLEALDILLQYYKQIRKELN